MVSGVLCASALDVHLLVVVPEEQRQALARADPNSPPMKEFLPQHIDHINSETFGQADLEKLIQHASRDLDEIDRKREEEFKEYEMRKEFERRAKLAVSFSPSPRTFRYGSFSVLRSK